MTGRVLAWAGGLIKAVSVVGLIVCFAVKGLHWGDTVQVLGAVALLAAALTALGVLRSRSGHAPRIRPFAPVPFMAIGAYLVLVIHASTEAPIGWAAASSLVLATIALAVTARVIVLGLGRSWWILLRAVLVGLPAAAAVSVLVVRPGPLALPPFVVVAAVFTTAALTLVLDLLLVGSGAAAPVDRGIGALTTVAICGCAWVVLSQEIAHHDAAATAGFGMGAVLLLTVFMIGHLGRAVVGALLFAVLCVGVFGVAVIAAWFAAIPGTVGKWAPMIAIIVGLVLAGGTKGVQAYTDLILGVPEKASEHSERLGHDQVVRSTLALVLFVLFGLGALMATLALALAFNPGVKLPGPTPLRRYDLVLCGSAALCLLLAVALFAVATKSAARGSRWAVWTATLAASLTLSALLLTDAMRQSAAELVKPTAFAAALVAVVWTVNSIVSNLWLLQGRIFGPFELILALGLGLLSGSAVLWLLTAGTQTGRGGRGVVQTLVLALVALFVLIALITFLGGAAGRGHRYLTELPPWRNLFQDTYSIAAIVLFTILPTEYMINNVGLWDGLKLALPPALLFAGGCIWVMSANRNWPEIEARRLLPADTASALLTDIGDRSWRRFRLDLHTQLTYRTRPVPGEHSEEFVRALGAHTRNQNRIAAAMFILPLVALPIGIGLFFESGQFGQLARHLARGLRQGA